MFKKFYEALKSKTETFDENDPENLEINFHLLKEIYTKNQNEFYFNRCKLQKDFMNYFECLMEERKEIEGKLNSL